MELNKFYDVLMYGDINEIVKDNENSLFILYNLLKRLEEYFEKMK